MDGKWKFTFTNIVSTISFKKIEKNILLKSERLQIEYLYIYLKLSELYRLRHVWRVLLYSYKKEFIFCC